MKQVQVKCFDKYNVISVPVFDDVDIPDIRHGDIPVGPRVGVEVITRTLRWLKTV